MEFLNIEQRDELPSFFSIMAAKSIENLLLPLIEQFVASNEVKKLIFITMLDEFYYSKFSGNVAECFYGIEYYKLSLKKRVALHLINLLLRKKSRYSERIKKLIKGVTFVYLILYMLDRSVYISPIHHILKLKIRNRTANSISGLLSLVANGFSIGMFVLQMIESNKSTKTVPDCPKELETTFRPKSGECVLCNNSFTEPAAIKSGYVFCYSCILKRLNLSGECPLTGMKCSVSDIKLLKFE